MDREELDDLMRPAQNLLLIYERRLEKAVEDLLTNDISDEAQAMALITALERVHARSVAVAVHVGFLPSDVATTWWEKASRSWKEAYDAYLALFDAHGLFSSPAETG